MKKSLWKLCQRASVRERILATAAISSSIARTLDCGAFAKSTPRAEGGLVNTHQIHFQPTIQFARHFFSTPWLKIGAQKRLSGNGDSDDGWEEEDDETTESQIGDGADGGGIVLNEDVPWGRRTLSIAQEVLSQSTDDADIVLFAFKTSPRGFIYLRLDKLTERYGCPTMEELEAFSRLYKTQLEKVGESGEIPKDLAVEVSSPGAERLLKVPEDLHRFKEMPVRVVYVDEDSLQKDGVFLLDSIDNESELSVWRLANVRENSQRKGKALSRKQKDWRLSLSFQAVKRVTLYLEF
ncbi:hypothetical protein H6P81_020005 [Aristolochia fimbriata]|uniref:DUF7912 domain-containing protein n=1 Tax=Aristolochia fimbriata TaxID=158543 RepID=A0AAV7DV44_ARIFI|nr:hypothetical protein H6P81_020005 [Aristolochia fimbriata]